ncbi:seryl-tRNA synthetase (SerRS2) [Toxoplasma gondii TgCatPRC2]|uniref:Seryl-tRNA synthetase (SerRS2) n=1 Tax=Toxoplasma gondii TgCatPRC2 TaxID=1130821 RepID=A0A151HP66_TOXGO|nr:seryl-tRNA synthetase (SerRS2) [Toxoplasma gondii TgCatPRC2]
MADDGRTLGFLSFFSSCLLLNRVSLLSLTLLIFLLHLHAGTVRPATPERLSQPRSSVFLFVSARASSPDPTSSLRVPNRLAAPSSVSSPSSSKTPEASVSGGQQSCASSPSSVAASLEAFASLFVSSRLDGDSSSSSGVQTVPFASSGASPQPAHSILSVHQAPVGVLSSALLPPSEDGTSHEEPPLTREASPSVSASLPSPTSISSSPSSSSSTSTVSPSPSSDSVSPSTVSASASPSASSLSSSSVSSSSSSALSKAAPGTETPSGETGKEKDVDLEGEDSVLISVNAGNFDRFLRAEERLVVFFYVPWCERCQNLFPEIYDAALRLRRLDPPIRVATVDSAGQEELARRLKAGAAPCVKLVRLLPAASPSSPASAQETNGGSRAALEAARREGAALSPFKGLETEEYQGFPDADRLVRWAMKRAGAPAYYLKDFATADRFLFDNPVTLLGVFDSDGQARDVFLQASHLIEEVTVAITNSTEIATKLQVPIPSVLLFRTYGEHMVVLGDRSSPALTPQDIARFTKEQRFPHVVPFSPSTAPDLFNDGRPLLILLRSEDEAGRQAEAALHEVAPRHRRGIISVVHGTKGAFAARLMNFLNLSIQDIPAAVIVENPSSRISKVQFVCEDKPLTRGSLERLIRDYRGGALRPTRKSAPPPLQAEQGHTVKLVGSTFVEPLPPPNSEMLLFVYSPWCAHSTKLRPVFEEVATRLAHIPELVTAELDGTVNEVEDVNVVSYQNLVDLRRRAGPNAWNGDSLLRPPSSIRGKKDEGQRESLWDFDRDVSLTDVIAADGYPALLFYTHDQEEEDLGKTKERKTVVFYDGVRDVQSILEFLLMHSKILTRERLFNSLQM